MIGQSSSVHSSSHPNLGQLNSQLNNQLNSQQRAPLPYPGQAPPSLNGSLGYSANLSSAGSDRASPSSLIGRTNLAAQMGFGSNPNLQSLDQLPPRLPQREQLTWQQQLLAQQQHPSPYESYGHQNPYTGGFQNHHGHHLPAVPTWQDSAASFQQGVASQGQLGHSPRAVAEAAAGGNALAWAGPQGLQNPHSMQPNSFGGGQGKAVSSSPCRCLAC